MTITKMVELQIDHNYEPRGCRHIINGEDHVLHCHHYASLYCQLADDAEAFDGKGMLVKASELSFLPLLKKMMDEQNLVSIEERAKIATEYWKFAGMGLLNFDRIGKLSAIAKMSRSHVDEGWIKKWGKRDAPVNFIGQGYVVAAMEAIYDLPADSISVQEIQSIVSGAEVSLFKLVRA